jgi:TolA-binding protein
MSVVDLHPEELIDKLADGSLTAAERERLLAHVSTCAACRFDLDVRRDFAAVAKELPPAVLVPGPSARDSQGSIPDVVPVAPRRRIRGPLLMLSLAAALVAGGSLAAFVARVVVAPSPATTSVDESPAARPQGGRVTSPRRAEPDVARAPEAAAPAVAPSAEPAPASPLSPSSVEGHSGAHAPSSGKHATPTAAALFSSANQARRDGNTTRAIALYRALETEYPASPEARVSHVTLSRLLLDRGDARSALDGFDEYLSQGGAALGEEALVGRALALQKLGSRDAEVAAWREVLRRFPKSVHARLARSRLSDLGAP